MSVHHVILPTQVFSLYPLLHYESSSCPIHEAGRQHRRWIIKIPKRHLQYMASQPGKTTRPANTMMHHSSIEGERGRDAALAGMFHNLPPLHDFRHSSLSVSKRMCTTGVNRVNTHVVHLDGSSLMIKMRHGYEEAGPRG